MNHHFKNLLATCAMAFAISAAPALLAADVRIGLSARETYVGLPIILRIQVANATQVDPPALPTIDGVAIKSLGNPSRSTQITSINGRTTTTTTQVFAFELTPQRTGAFQIPAIAINADGAVEHTRPVEFVAAKSETGDLMFVEIAGKEKQIYVGQALHLTLKIWLRPFDDSAKKITLSEADMWKMISDRSEWGPFAERMQLYADQNRRPSGTEVLRKDRDGVEHSYYLYEIEATIYPKRPGKIDGNNVKLIADYPTALGRARDPFAGFFDDMPFPGGRPPGFGDDDFSLFGSRLVVQSVRPVAAQANVEPIEVLPIPAAGRPADYRGAVGTYHIAVDASPTHVKAGDPINLYIGISGSGPMELVQAPPVSEIPDLNADFKVPTEPLAGLVKADRKIFSTMIRPRHAGITQIPSIPFSYFDPAAASFVTVRSNPISIQVDQSEMLALDGKTPGTKDKQTPPGPGNALSSDSPHSSLAIYTGDDLLLNEASWSPNLIAWALIFAGPPLAVLMILVARSRARLANFALCFTTATSRLQRELATASSHAEIAAALKRFAARHYKRFGAAGDAESILGAMRKTGDRDLATRLESLLNECGDDFRPVALLSKQSLEDLKRRALEWATDAEDFSRRAIPTPNPRHVVVSKSLRGSSATPSTSLLALAFAATCAALVARPATADEPARSSVAPVTASAAVGLDEQQQLTVLTEASTAYTKALEHLEHNAASAKASFEDAAEKYQLLADAGVENSRLYFNLANAYLESGQTSKAIANYHRALRIDPTFRVAQTNLAQAELQVQSSKTDPEQRSSIESPRSFVAVVNHWLTQNVTPRQTLAALALAWFAFWAVIACRLLGFRFPWKRSALSLALIASLLCIALIQIRTSSAQRLAVVIHPEVAASSDAHLSDGQAVEILQQRPDTVRIRTSDGREVWLPADALELI